MLDQGWQDAVAGNGRFIAIGGNPGIGKTRLITEFTQNAEVGRSRVLWSQMIEDAGAPPYFMWMLALRSCIQQSSADTLPVDLGSGASDIATIVPELRETLEFESHKPALESQIARYQLFDSVTRFLLRVAERKPLILLFDNLHSADQSSLEMLEYFCQQIANSAVLIVGAYRESEVDRRHPLRPALDRLARSTGYIRVELSGLSRIETATLLQAKSGRAPPNPLVNKVQEQSGGNPLFVTEVGSMLASRSSDLHLRGAGLHFQVPESLRDVITARLDTLTRDTCQLLRVAAVLGREFDASVLMELSSGRPQQIARQLSPAQTAGVIIQLSPGRYRFHHVLYREVLYAEHSTVSRVMLHQKAAEQLEARHKDDLLSHYSELAHHYFEAAQVGGAEKPIHYCRLAAKSAVAQRAYGEAVAFLDCALQVSELDTDKDCKRHFQLLHAKGVAEYQAGQLDIASQTLMKAAIYAYRRQWWEQLAEALHRFQLVCQQSGYRHLSSVPLHKIVLENLPDENIALRARVLTSLAKAYRTAAEPEIAMNTFRRGASLARQCDDPVLLLDCLQKGNWVIGRSPATVQEGLEIARETLLLATQQSNSSAALDSVVDIIFQLCDLGELGEAQQQIAALAKLAERERQPHFRNVLVGFETALAILRGEWVMALRKAREGIHQLPLQHVRGLHGRFAFQIFAIRKARGSLGELREFADEIVAASVEEDLWLPGQALLYCELGELARARGAIRKLGDLINLPDDDLLLTALIYLSESCLKLGDQARCRELYDRLELYRGMNVTLPGTFMLGAASGFLARLAVATRRFADAHELFEEALAMNIAMKALPALATSQVEYARFLLRSEVAEDRTKACRLVAEARTTAESLGLQPVLATIAELADASGADGLTGREIDVLKTIATGLSNNGIAALLHISHSTVATHVRNIFRKIGVANRTEAAEFARRTGLLDHE